MASSISPELVATFKDKPIVDFANTYFAHIPDVQERLRQATQAVRNTGYGVGRGVIYLPTVKRPDVEIATTTGTGQQYLKVKGKFSKNPRAMSGLTGSIFPSGYSDDLSISMMSYGGKQPLKGMKATIKRSDIVVEPDQSLVIKLRIYPEPTLLPLLQGWILNVPRGKAPTGQGGGQYYPPQSAQAQPSAQAQGQDCFGLYNPAEPECIACGQAVACKQTSPQV